MSFHIDIPKGKVAEFRRQWKITERALFGSALRDDFGPESDIDILVSFASDAAWSLLDHVRMERELEKILKRRVDLVSRRAVERSGNRIRRDAILSSARIIHAA